MMWPRGPTARSMFPAAIRYCVCPARAISTARLFASFEANAGGLAFHPDGRLLVCVSGRGLAAVDRSGKQTWLNQAGDQPLNCLTSVAAAPDGSIFVSNGSSRNLPEDWCADLMQKNTSGAADQLRTGARPADGFAARPRLSPWPGHCARPKDALAYAELESLPEPRFRCRARRSGRC